MMIAAVALVVVILLVAFILIPRGPKYGHTKKVDSNVTYDKPARIYTKAEVSLHNKRTDCWVIIKDKVYDVTSYVEEHPGGDAILDHAGDDSTEGFFGPQHATRVFDMINDFYIGDLKL
ncbi:cytochrome B5-like protein [Prunus avium]|uniref:Cytochrome B5-like protein n=1 Tax=Prunus avium TaxID=42229 RepID=A0A6P5RQH1_PRUAV|nr:cytochrome B5-like protein [Prunus avium]